MAKPALCVIVNPAAARGAAKTRLRHFRRWLAMKADFRFSQGRGDAEALAYEAVRAGYQAVVAAGGDGTVHEVANGLLRAGQPGVSFGVIPLGSGNDYASSLKLPNDDELLCRHLLSERTRYVDVGEVCDDRGHRRYFVNTLGLGLSGAVAYESRKIKGLSGLPLYTLGTLQAICRHFHSPQTVLTLDDQQLNLPTLYLCVALGQREGGGFIIAPDALLDDGLFDYLHAARMNRWQALRYLPRLVGGRLPADDPAIRRGRCRKVLVQSTAPLLIHLDGELFTTPRARVQTISVEIHPWAMRVCG